jgi:hypothetical protein
VTGFGISSIVNLWSLFIVRRLVTVSVFKDFFTDLRQMNN